jgi:hypothetical protein
MSSADLQARYGQRASGRRRLLGLVSIGVLGAALLAWAVWAGLARGRADVRWQLLAFDTRAGDSVTVRFTVRAGADAFVECDVGAQNRLHETVGLKRVEVPRGSTVRTMSVTVPVREPAVAAVVESCRTVPG